MAEKDVTSVWLDPYTLIPEKIKTGLSELGHNLLDAQSPDEAKEKVLQEGVDFVITDRLSISLLLTTTGLPTSTIVYMGPNDFRETAAIRYLEKGVEHVQQEDSPEVMAAHMMAIKRRKENDFETSPQPKPVKLGEYVVDAEKGTVRKNGELVQVPGNPYRALMELARAQGQVVPVGRIESRIWGEPVPKSAIRHVMTRARRSIEDTHNPRYILNDSQKDGYYLNFDKEE